MAIENLKQTLSELHAALTTSGPLDPELVQLLKTLDTDIQSRLADQRSIVATEAGLTSRAQAISATFAAQHPRLEPILRELTDTLQRIGI